MILDFFCRNQNIITFCRGSRVLIAHFMPATRGIKYKNIMSSRECRLLNPFERSAGPFVGLAPREHWFDEFCCVRVYGSVSN